MLNKFRTCEHSDKIGCFCRCTEFLIGVVLIGLMIFILCIQGGEITRISEELDKVKGENYALQKELESSLEDIEGKCQRMTDTCIDIITNKRWE